MGSSSQQHQAMLPPVMSTLQHLPNVVHANKRTLSLTCLVTLGLKRCQKHSPPHALGAAPVKVAKPSMQYHGCDADNYKVLDRTAQSMAHPKSTLELAGHNRGSL